MKLYVMIWIRSTSGKCAGSELLHASPFAKQYSRFGIQGRSTISSSIQIETVWNSSLVCWGIFGQRNYTDAGNRSDKVNNVTFSVFPLIPLLSIPTCDFPVMFTSASRYACYFIVRPLLLLYRVNTFLALLILLQKNTQICTSLKISGIFNWRMCSQIP